MAEKVTKMSIKVDLQCSRCHRKIKKILCEFPQIRDQTYDEKQNMVLITVVCCSPEKIRQKIICKGGETVLSVEILPDKPKEPKEPEEPKKQKDTKEPEEPEEPKKQKDTKEPKEPEEPKKQKDTKEPEEPEEPKNQKDTKEPKKPEKKPVMGCALVPVYPMVPVFPMVGVCCCPTCFGGYGGGPCYCGRRIPAMCYDGCGRPADECQGGNIGSHPGQGRLVLCDDGCGRPACECQGGNRGYHVSPCDYLSEENATACTVM